MLVIRSYSQLYDLIASYTICLCKSYSKLYDRMTEYMTFQQHRFLNFQWPLFLHPRGIQKLFEASNDTIEIAFSFALAL